jgi:hypothetical protein
MIKKMKNTFFVIFLGSSFVLSSKATQSVLDVDFDVLTQERPFKGEGFFVVEEQKLELSSPSPKALIKHLKLWPSLYILPTNDISTKTQELQGFFYNQYLPLLNKDKFQEAKGSLIVARNLKFYGENAFSNFIDRAKRCINPLLFEGINKIADTADPEILYWAWKNRELFSDSFLPTSVTWEDILIRAATHPTKVSARAQYALGRVLEGHVGDNYKEQALDFYKKAAGGYQKAQLYLDYLSVKDSDALNRTQFYEKVAEIRDTEFDYLQYPHAQYVMGSWILSQQKVGQVNVYDERVKRGFTYLQSAARYGIKEAQEQLDQLRNQDKDLFYRLCNVSDQCENEKKRLEFLREKAEKNLAPYAYQLAQMYEDGRGVPFETPKEWLEALGEAKCWYDMASLYKIQNSDKDSQRVQQKIDLINNAKGYLLNKIVEIIKGATVSFSPHHPLFVEFCEFLNVLYAYSPGAKYLGACLIQQLLETHQNIKENKKIIEDLLSFINSSDFKDQLTYTVQHKFKTREKKQVECKEVIEQVQKSMWEETDIRTAKEELRGEKTEAEEAARLFRYMVEKLQPSTEQTPSPHSSGVIGFLKTNQTYIFRKIEKGAEGIKAEELPNHPLFEDFSIFINLISRYEGSVPEHGAHLIQQLLYFPPHSYQGKVLITSLLDLLKSEKFQYGEEGDSKEEIDEYRVNKLAKLNQIIELTRKPCKLLSPYKEEQEGGVPKKVKVNRVMFRDPRIQVFNYYFEQENKPFDRQEFDQSVEAILKIYDRLESEGKITQDLLLDKDEQSPTRGKYGNKETLYKLLTNLEGFGSEIPNRFGHRIIKIRSILGSGKIDDGTLVNLLSSWAVAGLNCTTRSEGETHRFYNMYVTEGKSQENENDTLEVKVALALADLRRQLLHKVVRVGEVEPLHKINYLEKKHGKKLALMDAQGFQDLHERIVPEYCRNLTTSIIRAAILDGDKTYKINIEPGRGYRNPDVLVEYLAKVINDKKSSIFQLIRNRIEDQYKGNWSDRMTKYCNEDDGKVTTEGVRALLFSLGYLEKDLGPKDNKGSLGINHAKGDNSWSVKKKHEAPSLTQGSSLKFSPSSYQLERPSTTSSSQVKSNSDLMSGKNHLFFGGYPTLEDIKQESLKAAKGKIGSREIPGWELYDVDDKGNCFYDAVAHQMQLISHSFLEAVPYGTLPRDSLRLLIQGKDFEDEQWAEDGHFDVFVKKIDVILAIIDTRRPEDGYVYYYLGEDKEVITRVSDSDISLPNKSIIRLAATGNHFLSVVSEPPEKINRIDKDSISILNTGITNKPQSLNENSGDTGRDSSSQKDFSSQLKNLKSQFLSGNLPEHMKDESYDSLKGKFNLCSMNVDRLVESLNKRFFSSKEEKTGEKILIHLGDFIKENPNNRDYIQSKEKLSSFLSEQKDLDKQIENYCRRQLGFNSTRL